MARWISFIGGIGLGASLMYFADPDKGRRRRALVRDQLVHGFNLTDEAIDTTGRDLSHRAQGLMAEISSLGSSERVADDVLVVVLARAHVQGQIAPLLAAHRSPSRSTRRARRSMSPAS